MKSTLEVICLESEAFYALVDEVVDRIKSENNIKEDPWIKTEEAMEMLGIGSKTTLQKLRDEGSIRFTAPTPRKFLYHRGSIAEHLKKKARDTF